MKVFFALVVAIAVGACTAPNGMPVVFDGSVAGVAHELANPGSTYQARLNANDAKCQQAGNEPGTEAYRACRRQLDDQIK
jgi:hypothetical protein